MWFLYSFNKHLWSTFCVPGLELGVEEATESKVGEGLALKDGAF